MLLSPPLATAQSNFPSPLKSPLTTAVGRKPAGRAERRLKPARVGEVAFVLRGFAAESPLTLAVFGVGASRASCLLYLAVYSGPSPKACAAFQPRNRPGSWMGLGIVLAPDFCPPLEREEAGA